MEKKCALGVDIGTGSIKALVGMINGRDNITIIGSGFVPTVGFSKGHLTDSAELAKAVKEAIDCAVMASRAIVETVYLGIGGLDIVSVNGIGSIATKHENAITGEDVARAARAATVLLTPENHRTLHSLPTGYWVDGKKSSEVPVGYCGTRLEVEAHIVSLPELVIGEIIAALSAQGIQVAGVIANAVTVAEIYASTFADHPCMVIDIGAGLVDLVLYYQGKIWLSASIPLGGDYVTSDIMQSIGVSRTHAEEIKRYYAKLSNELRGQDIVLDCNSYGTTDKKVTYDFLAKVIESRVEEIVDMIHQYIQPVLSRHGLEKVILTGGSALLPSFATHTEKILGVLVEVVGLKGMVPVEYDHPSNVACYGILRTVARRTLAERSETDGRDNLWCSLVNRIKRFM
ncbi:MAG: cell division protein FtsA [Firmicutes bacterium]|nr:cell division protein FtsA [Bacillota bacterium]